MTSIWTVQRNLSRKRRLAEYDELFQVHLEDLEASVDRSERSDVPDEEYFNDPVTDKECGNEYVAEHEEDFDEDGSVAADEPAFPQKYRLAFFVSEFRLSVEATRALLGILRAEGLDVPKCRETLLETPQTSLIPKREPPGEYIHFGIQNCLSRLSEDPRVSVM